MKNLFFLLCIIYSIKTFSQPVQKQPAGLAYIREAGIRADLFALASDSMRGRRGGTLDEFRAAAWVAEQARKAGLAPAGDDGTYFQFFPIRRTQTGESSRLELNGNNLSLWKDSWVSAPVQKEIEGIVIWLGSAGDTSQNLAGKIVAMDLHPPDPLPAPGMSLWGYRYALAAIRQQTILLRRHNVGAIVLVADAVTEGYLGFLGRVMERGTYSVEGTPSVPNTNNIPVILVSASTGLQLKGSAARLALHLSVQSYVYPSANVVAKVAGTNATLSKEYVLFSGHHDHDGVGAPVDGDSIWNGADDNATVSVALLAIGRAWAKTPGQRSALFIWHGAEERGLLGSRWYAEHPTISKGSMVAVLNGDMIGRNNPDSAALLGTQSPHRNSDDLVSMAMAANSEGPGFKLDTLWDKREHPEGWYFRSDHLPYARAGIPALFYTTLLHSDYHTPKDEASRIDIKKLTRMTQWMYRTGWKVANAAERPKLNTNARLER